MKFTLEIQTGNDAMLTFRDISKSLLRVAQQMQHNGDRMFQDACKIIDRNGNTVGKWEMK